MSSITFNIPRPYNKDALEELLHWGSVLEQGVADVTSVTNTELSKAEEPLNTVTSYGSEQSSSESVEVKAHEVNDLTKRRGRPRKTDPLISSAAAVTADLATATAALAAASGVAQHVSAAVNTTAPQQFPSFNNAAPSSLHADVVAAEAGFSGTQVPPAATWMPPHTVTQAEGQPTATTQTYVSSGVVVPPGYQPPAMPSFHPSPLPTAAGQSVSLEEIRRLCADTQKTHPGLFVRVMRAPTWQDGTPKPWSVVTLERVPVEDYDKLLNEIATLATL